MRIELIAVCFVSSAGMAWAQALPENKNADKPESSTGRTVTPETKGQLQPQGWTGPISTKPGGAPASSPQGETAPGMQAAPEGSSKTVVEPDKKQQAQPEQSEPRFGAKVRAIHRIHHVFQRGFPTPIGAARI